MLTIAGVPVLPDGAGWCPALYAGASWCAEVVRGRVVAYHVTAEVYSILEGKRDG